MKKITLLSITLLLLISKIYSVNAKDSLTPVFELYKTQEQNSVLWYWLSHGYQTRFYYDGRNWKIEIKLPNWKINKFAQKTDFKYHPSIENDLKAEEDANHLKITDENKVYFFWKTNQQLEKIEIKYLKYPKNTINIIYNDNWTIKQIQNTKHILNFEHQKINKGDKSKLILKKITGTDKQTLLEFKYKKFKNLYILEYINDTKLQYNQNIELINNKKVQESITQYFENLNYQNQVKKYELSTKLQKKLKKIKVKIIPKLTSKQKAKLGEKIKTNKQKYINQTKPLSLRKKILLQICDRKDRRIFKNTINHQLSIYFLVFYWSIVVK